MSEYSHCLFGVLSHFPAVVFMHAVDVVVVAVFPPSYVQLTRKTKEISVKSVNNLKLMTLKTNEPSYIFRHSPFQTSKQQKNKHIHTFLNAMQCIAMQKVTIFHVFIFVLISNFYVVAGITICYGNVSFV